MRPAWAAKQDPIAKKIVRTELHSSSATFPETDGEPFSKLFPPSSLLPATPARWLVLLTPGSPATVQRLEVAWFEPAVLEPPLLSPLQKRQQLRC